MAWDDDDDDGEAAPKGESVNSMLIKRRFFLTRFA
jgi:hypothetical protein